MVTITLPMPPTANHIWQHAGGRHYLSAAYEQFKRHVANQIMVADLPTYLKERIAVRIDLHFKSKHRCDIENRVKALNDAISQSSKLWADDALIDLLIVQRKENDSNGKCVVSVCLMEECEELF